MVLKGEAPGQPTYRIIDQFPTGPGREVYLAYHEVFRGPCIQKTVNLAGLPGSMLLSEPQLLERLSHDHIVTIREAQFDPADPSLVTFVMPFYEGGSALKHLLAGERFSVGQSVALCDDLLDALAYLHTEVGFVHRDVKLDNLLLDAPQRTGYLSDFGSATRLDANGRAPVAGFTLPYLDPASIPNGATTVQSDVYSAGLTLFELLSGTLLPRFDPAKATVRLPQGKRAYPDSVLIHAVHVPDPVRRVVNKAIHVDPTHRYQSASDFASALARAGRRAIDWTHTAGDGLDGEWLGTWPPNKPPARRRTYRVQSSVVARGVNAGLRRLEASYETDRGWRRFGGLVQDVAATDHAAVSKFFDTVDDAVAQNRAAR